MYYPDQARYAQIAAAALGLGFVDLDDGNGYVFAIVGKTRRVLSGGGWICSYPVNNASSYNISRDKAHTKSVLRQSFIKVIHGNHFFTSQSHAALRNPGHELADALPFATALGFPVFCKPNSGARGDCAELVINAEGLLEYIERFPPAYDALLIERVMKGDEYRVLMYDAEPIYYVLKRPPSITGDGIAPLSALLETTNRSLAGTGVSPYPISAVLASGFTPDYIPSAGEVVPLVGRQNLSALGGVDRLDTNVPEPLYKIARASCQAVGLRVGAVDIFDTSAKRDLSELTVIEVNGNPTLKALESYGRLDLIIKIWKSMLIELMELKDVRA